jgi:hypothetical protein
MYRHSTQAPFSVRQRSTSAVPLMDWLQEIFFADLQACS